MTLSYQSANIKFMLMVRLQRVGKKHDPSFRVVLADSRRAARSGSVKDILGFYNARKNQTKLNGDKIKEWISKGAKPSDTVRNLLVKERIIKGPKINVLPPKKRLAEEAKAEKTAIQAKQEEKKEEQKDKEQSSK